MKFNKRKFLRYRVAFWLVIAMITLPSGPMHVWAALNNPAIMSAVSLVLPGVGVSVGCDNIDEYKRFKRFEDWSN